MGCTMGRRAGTELEEQVKMTTITDEHKRKGFFFSFFLREKTKTLIKNKI